MQVDLPVEVKEAYEQAKQALEEKGLKVEMLFVPRYPPFQNHPALHMQATHKYHPGGIDVIYLTNHIVTSELGAYALAALILEQWLDHFELYTMETGGL